MGWASCNMGGLPSEVGLDAITSKTRVGHLLMLIDNFS